MSRGTIWDFFLEISKKKLEKKVSEKITIIYFFRTISEKNMDPEQKVFSTVVKSAFYMSIGTFWEKKGSKKKTIN